MQSKWERRKLRLVSCNTCEAARKINDYSKKVMALRTLQVTTVATQQVCLTLSFWLSTARTKCRLHRFPVHRDVLSKHSVTCHHILHDRVGLDRFNAFIDECHVLGIASCNSRHRWRRSTRCQHFICHDQAERLTRERQRGLKDLNFRAERIQKKSVCSSRGLDQSKEPDHSLKFQYRY